MESHYGVRLPPVKYGQLQAKSEFCMHVCLLKQMAYFRRTACLISIISFERRKKSNLKYLSGPGLRALIFIYRVTINYRDTLHDHQD